MADLINGHVSRDILMNLYRQALGIANTMAYVPGTPESKAYADGLHSGLRHMAAWLGLDPMAEGEGRRLSDIELSYINGK